MTEKIDLVELRKTSPACPSQWEGYYKSDKGYTEFYARYRHGTFRAERFNPETGMWDVFIHDVVGGGMDGSMTTSDLAEVLARFDYQLVVAGEVVADRKPLCPVRTQLSLSEILLDLWPDLEKIKDPSEPTKLFLAEMKEWVDYVVEDEEL